MSVGTLYTTILVSLSSSAFELAFSVFRRRLGNLRIMLMRSSIMPCVVSRGRAFNGTLRAIGERTDACRRSEEHANVLI